MILIEKTFGFGARKSYLFGLYKKYVVFTLELFLIKFHYVPSKTRSLFYELLLGAVQDENYIKDYIIKLRKYYKKTIEKIESEKELEYSTEFDRLRKENRELREENSKLKNDLQTTLSTINLLNAHEKIHGLTED
jgi:cell shape-determining protein MreC